MGVPERLKQIRESKGQKQYEVAAHLGISQAAYSRFEGGERTPSISIITKLSKFWGVTTDEILSPPDLAA